MQKYAKYDRYQLNDPNIEWFWKTLESWDERMKANFLFFLTGISSNI